MPVETLYLSGPPGCGKTALARVITQARRRPAHLLRMRLAADGHTNAILPLSASGQWASTHNVFYTPDRVFETLPDALRKIRESEHRPFVVMEADADPALRHAYPYDYRAFVMRPPADLHEVFRSDGEAAAAMREVMQDTASFACEIFGLMDPLDDALDAQAPETPPRRHEESDTAHMTQFLDSPLGAEIAARIQLQPQYYALVEADVAVINVDRNAPARNLEECLRRIEKLLAHIQHEARRQSALYSGDLADTADPLHAGLARRFETLFGG